MERTEFTPGMKLMLFFVIWIGMQLMANYVYGAFIAVFTNIDVETTDFSAPYMQLSRLFISSIFVYTMSFYLYVRITKDKFTSLFFKDPLKLKYFIISLLVLGGGMIVMHFLQEFNELLAKLIPNNALIEIQMETREAMEKMLDNDKPIQLLLTIVVMAIIPAITEELVFRGLLIGKLMNTTKKIHFSVIISALIFAGVHFQPLNLLPILFMGICFGYIYVYFKNIWYTIIIHFLNNLAVVLIPFFA